ncbi:MAG: response regulator, partial [Verrucomicrobiae bacterium]|nr:response regulator [Verrucomicrobiae bacterium]
MDAWRIFRNKSIARVWEVCSIIGAAMEEKPALLIVDDEKPTREGIRAALEDKYDVYVAEDAATAIGLLEQQKFDVVLTDFR